MSQVQGLDAPQSRYRHRRRAEVALPGEGTLLVDERLEGGFGLAGRVEEAGALVLVRLIVLPVVPDNRLHGVLGEENGDEALDDLLLPGGIDAACAEIDKRMGGTSGMRVRTHAAGCAEDDHERHTNLRPAIEQAAKLLGVAWERAAGPVAVLNFEANAGEAEFAAHERVGEVVGSQLLVLAG